MTKLGALMKVMEAAADKINADRDLEAAIVGARDIGATDEELDRAIQVVQGASR